MELEEGNQSIFGYGSLILPTSLVGRFINLEQSVDEIYEEELGLEDESLVREEAEEAWDELKENLGLLPVRVRGFKRTYSFESPRGGAMLEAEYTDDESDYINGIVVTGLSEEQTKKIDSSEDGYQRIDVPSKYIEHYLDDETLEEMELELPEHIEVYVAEDENALFDKKTRRTRNETYHARIIRGIDMLGELFGEAVAQEFYEDFLESTYERNFLTEKKWVTISYSDSIGYLFKEVIDKCSKEK